MVASLYIYSNIFLAFSWGGGRISYLGRDAFLGVSVFLRYWTPQLICRWIAYIIVELIKCMFLY